MRAAGHLARRPAPSFACAPSSSTPAAPPCRSTLARPICRERLRRCVMAAAQPQQQHQHQQGLAVAQQQQQQPDGGAPEQQSRALDDEYNKQMAKQMGWSDPFEYHFDRGLYFHEVHTNLICGTQPRSPQELEELARLHGVRTVVNLQQDGDMEYWGVDWRANAAACERLGLELVRRPARDFDPHSLRKMLPGAVKAVNAALADGKRVYVHCTAGLGRAPAVCIAWLYWFGPFLSLDDAYGHLTSIRPCGPRKQAVRGATYDVIDDRPFEEFDRLPERTWAFMNGGDRQRLQRRLARGGWA